MAQGLALFCSDVGVVAHRVTRHEAFLVTHRFPIVVSLAAACLLLADPGTAQTAGPPPDELVFGRPTAEGGRIWSMGQPPIVTWHASMLLDTSGRRGLAALGAQKDLLSPISGLAAARLEGIVGGGQNGIEGGARLLAVSPVARLHTGLDFDARTGRTDWLLGTEWNLRRGGLLGHGTRLRVEWMPGRDHTVQVGVTAPLGQRAGRTRPRRDHRQMPEAQPLPRQTTSTALHASLHGFRAAAEAVTRLAMPLRGRLGADAVKAVAQDVAEVAALDAPERLSRAMQEAWPGVFQAALSAAGQAPPTAVVDRIATRARRLVLEEILLPFDGLLGQRRRPETIAVFARQAAHRFESELTLASDLTAAQRASALSAFLDITRELDGVRAGIRKNWGTNARLFMPLQVALLPEEADTQAELDALVERATGNRFSEGNRVYYVLNEAFQFEFTRTVKQAEQYHVLWIHDVRGRSESGPVDRVSAMHVREYLDALTARVQRYDETGTLPQYFIILDQYFYQANDGRLWMTILERPLEQAISFPPEYAAEQAALRQAQQQLRDAVAASRRLQERRATYGERWLHDLVKVHVNITHPSDFSFWASGLIPIVGMPDNLMRDHRKIVFYDISEDDPYRGEAIFSGMGLGEHYAGATWEDRALIVQGPAVLDVKAAARRLFERQRFGAHLVPAVFHARALAPDYATRVEAERRRAEAGAVPPARAMQAHNDVGYGVKQASVVKAILASTMPAGSVVIAPDSLWEDNFLGSLLLGSALRGARVLVIAPSLANAPGTAWPVMARAYMLVSRMLALSRALDARITSQGGLFKVGLFTETSGVGDLAARARAELDKTRFAEPWFSALAPYDAATLARWEERTNALERTMPPAYLVPPPQRVRPKLHMKGLFAATRSAWDGLFTQPAMSDTLLEYLEQRSRQVSGEDRAQVDLRALPEAVWVPQRRLLDAHLASLSPEDAVRVAYFMQIGSYNMNDRSMLLDGEVELTVSGPAALAGMFDFLTVSGMTTWIERQEQIEALLPPPSKFKRLLARWARSLL